MTGMDDLATWLRAQLDHHADAHRRLVEAEGQDVPGEREADPDGFWALHDAHRGILDYLTSTLKTTATMDSEHATAEDLMRLLALAYQHAGGYRDEWRPE
jgi:hypothetical protein